MLNFIRVHAQGWIAWFIVALITIPFALWGVNSYLTGGSNIVVAKINDEEITQPEYKKALQQYREQMRTRLGDKFDPSIFDKIEIKQAVLNSMIDKRLLRLASYDIGQKISDKRILRNIQSTPAFQKDGQFDANTYNRLLARSGLSASRFEANLRSDMLSQEIIGNIEQSVILGDYLVKDVLRLENQVREIAYGVIYVKELAKSINISDVAVRDYYEKHKASYQAPEQMVVDYVELSVDDLSKDIDVDDDKLQQFYNDNKNLFITPEQRQISHILIEGDNKEALATIEKIQQRLENGEAFSSLASEFSKDSGSASNGGDLGLFQRKTIEPAFEKIVFDQLSEGEVSKPIKTEFGYHLVKLTHIQPGVGKSFDQAKQEVKTMYRRQQAEELFYDKAQQLADLSYENPDSLQITSEELGLKIKTSPSFTRSGGTGIAEQKKVVDAAFSEDVLTNDLNSSVIELSKSDMVVIHKNKYTESSQLPFESVAPSIREQLRFELARDQAKQKGEELINKLKAGESAVALLGKDHWETKQLVTRTTESVNRQILQHAFSAPKPEKSNTFVGFTANNGNYVVVQVSAVLEGKEIPKEFVKPKQEEQLIAYLTNVYSDSELQAFIANLKESADVEIFEKNL